MKRRKRLLSLFLAICIAFTAMSVGFYAIAAQQSDAGKQDPAVTDLETRIADWSSNHSKYLYSTKEAEADQKAEAEKLMNDINAKMQKLTESQKLSMTVCNFAYWMGVIQDNIARTDSSKPASSPTAANRYAVWTDKIDRVEKMMGTLPADYKTALETAKLLTVKADGKNPIVSNSCNFKNEDAAKTLLKFVKAYETQNEHALALLDYIYPTSGVYYMNASVNASKDGAMLSNLLNYTFYYQQDITEGSTGANPATVSNSTFISRSGYGTTATYSWKAGQSAETYIDGFEKYLSATKASCVKPSENALAQVLEALDANPLYKGVKDAVNAAISIGTEVFKNGTAKLSDIEAAQTKINALHNDAAVAYNKIMSSSALKLAAELQNVYKAADLTPALGYSTPTKLKTYTGAELYKFATDVQEDLKLRAFNEFVADVNTGKKTEADMIKAQSLYNALNSEFKKKITDETMAKFARIMKPAADPDNFAKVVKNFKPTTIVRPKDSEVAMTKGGIQSAVDNLWSLVATVVVPMISSDIDLTNGLDGVLEDNVYTIDMINKIFDLYATLSHNETETGVSLAPTIGKVVQLLISPNGYAGMLDEAKYAGIVEKIKANCSISKDEEAQGITALDKLAAIEFTNADFGFKNGDRAGFENALLAALRPITTLLRDENGIVGMAGLKFHMFDYQTEDGTYVDGLYARLIPLLEQLGLTSLPTAEEYKANFEAVRDNTDSKDIASDEFLRPILDALLKDVVDVVSADPLNGLIQILPRVAYIIHRDMLTTTLKDIAQSTGSLLTGLTENLDLSGSFFNNLLTKDPIDLTGVVGKTCKIQLKAIDWKKLANCCTVKSIPSHSNHNKYFVLRTGETDTAFTTVFYYLYDVAFADKANYKAIKALIQQMMGDSASTVLSITDQFVSMGKVATYGQVLDLLGTPGDEPIDGGNGNGNSNSNNSNNNSNKNNNSSNKKPNGNKNNISKNNGNKTDIPKMNNSKNNISKNNAGNWKSPSTGACVFGGAALLAIGGALMILYFRRKNDAVTE